VSDLQALIRAELSEPVDPRVRDMASAIAALHPSSVAVLFYGSCLRESQLDGLMLDFYLIVSDYRQAYAKRWLATANRLIPPNVFPFAHEGLAAKYAVLSEADFGALMGVDASTVSVWARFAQPTRLVWTSGADVDDRMVSAISQAPRTVMRLAKPIAASADVITLWQTAFAETYKAELRAERGGRSTSIVDADPARYAAIGAAAAAEPYGSVEITWKRWKALQRHGKLMSIVRLAKASLTFSGGIDYLAWKINRHAGTEIEVKPWQRRWPLMAAITLVPKLFRQGAIK
jgi:hypothetical protein